MKKYFTTVFIFLSLFFWLGENLSAQIITTIAGDGTQGYNGDGFSATAAGLHYPSGIAFDSFGNMYIADCFNNRIRKVNSSGSITTVAGVGTPGYSGDGGVATSAELYYPTEVTFDAAGNMYIADYGNHLVRMVNISGIITTFAGNGTPGYSGDGGIATSAEIYNPWGVTFDVTGNMYIADAGNNRIRRVNTSGIITTVAGNGTPGYSGDGGTAILSELNNPRGVIFDATGNMYIAEYLNNSIRKVNSSGIITTMAGNGTGGYSGDGGPATAADLFQPSGITIDAAGNLYIADAGNNRIRQVNTSGNINTVAGNGTSGYNGDGFAATVAELYPNCCKT